MLEQKRAGAKSGNKVKPSEHKKKPPKKVRATGKSNVIGDANLSPPAAIAKASSTR